MRSHTACYVPSRASKACTVQLRLTGNPRSHWAAGCASCARSCRPSRCANYVPSPAPGVLTLCRSAGLRAAAVRLESALPGVSAASQPIPPPRGRRRAAVASISRAGRLQIARDDAARVSANGARLRAHAWAAESVRLDGRSRCALVQRKGTRSLTLAPQPSPTHRSRRAHRKPRLLALRAAAAAFALPSNPGPLRGRARARSI